MSARTAIGIAVLLLGACNQVPRTYEAPRIVEVRAAGEAIFFRWDSAPLPDSARFEYALQASEAPAGEEGETREWKTLGGPAGARLCGPLKPGRYGLALRAVLRDPTGREQILEAAAPEAPVELVESGYRFVRRSELELSEPIQLRVIYTLHPYWREDGDYLRAGIPPQEREVLAAVSRNVLAEAFQDARDLAVIDGSPRTWERIEELRVLIGQRWRAGGIQKEPIPDFIDPHALVTIDYRRAVPGRNHPAQLSVRLFDMSATGAGTAEERMDFQPALGRTLIFEDYVELEWAVGAGPLSLALVEGWKEILHEMNRSARVHAFLETLAAPRGRLGTAVEASWLLGSLNASALGNPGNDLQGFHDKVETEVLFPGSGDVPISGPSRVKVPARKPPAPAKKPAGTGEAKKK